MGLLTKTIGSALVVATFAFSFSADAACRRDRHDAGKVIGTLLGAAAGASLAHNLGGGTNTQIASGVGGAVAGGVLGDQIDDKNDCEDAYERSRSRRGSSRSRSRSYEAREAARYEREEREYIASMRRDEYRPVAPVPAAQGYTNFQEGVFQCQQIVETGEYINVDTRTNRIIDGFGGDIVRCKDTATYRNGY